MTSPNGLSFQPMHSLTTLPPLTYLVIPGGEGTELVSQDTMLTQKLADIVTQVEAVLTICTGSFILQVLGRTNIRVCTTAFFRLLELYIEQTSPPTGEQQRFSGAEGEG